MTIMIHPDMEQVVGKNIGNAIISEIEARMGTDANSSDIHVHDTFVEIDIYFPQSPNQENMEMIPELYDVVEMGVYSGESGDKSDNEWYVTIKSSEVGTENAANIALLVQKLKYITGNEIEIFTHDNEYADVGVGADLRMGELNEIKRHYDIVDTDMRNGKHGNPHFVLTLGL